MHNVKVRGCPLIIFSVYVLIVRAGAKSPYGTYLLFSSRNTTTESRITDPKHHFFPTTQTIAARLASNPGAPSKPPQAVAERAARFDAMVVFIQRPPVPRQPLAAPPDDFGQMQRQRLRKIDIELFRLLQEIGVDMAECHSSSKCDGVRFLFDGLDEVLNGIASRRLKIGFAAL